MEKTNITISHSHHIRALDINLIGCDQVLLDGFCKFILGAASAMGAAKVIPASGLAMEMDRWTVLSSPHVHKTARTQFERRIHRRIVKVNGLDEELSKELVWYINHHIPPDVQIDVDFHTYHQIIK